MKMLKDRLDNLVSILQIGVSDSEDTRKPQVSMTDKSDDSESIHTFEDQVDIVRHQVLLIDVENVLKGPRTLPNPYLKLIC
jgi:hypothetical protein